MEVKRCGLSEVADSVWDAWVECRRAPFALVACKWDTLAASTLGTRLQALQWNPRSMRHDGESGGEEVRLCIRSKSLESLHSTARSYCWQSQKIKMCVLLHLSSTDSDVLFCMWWLGLMQTDRM